MTAYLRNCSYSVLCTTNIIAVRLKTYLEGLPHVGIVIDDQNVRSTHFGTYLVIRKLWESITRLSFSLRHTQGAFHSRKVVSSPVHVARENVIFCLHCGVTREPTLGVVPLRWIVLQPESAPPAATAGSTSLSAQRLGEFWLRGLLHNPFMFGGSLFGRIALFAHPPSRTII